MLKQDIRRLFREKRKALPALERNKLDDLLLIRFQAVQLPFIAHVLTYSPIEANGEPNVDLLTGYLEFIYPGLQVAYPRTDFTALNMEAVVPDEEKGFTTTVQQLLEPVGGTLLDPSLLDLVIVPLLAVDKNGYRVGYGKGFYDRYLSRCNPRCIKVGCSYFEPVDPVSDADDFDVPLDLCITPQNVYVF